MMNRWLARLAAIVWIVCAPHAAAQSGAVDIEGRYEVLQPPQLTETGDRIEVVDVFLYSCPHCYSFMPLLEQFERDKPGYVEIRRLPVIFRGPQVNYARAFYTARVLGIVEKTHRALFEEIHKHRRPTDDRNTLGEFFERHGVDRAEFDRTFDSFAVDSMVRKSVVMQERYGIPGTPAVIVNGKYRVTARLAGGQKNMIAVVRALAEQEYKAQSASN